MTDILSRLKNAQKHLRRTGRPLVTLSYAQSIDGCIARRPGRPLALSNRQSLTMAHRLRSLHDAILVGIGTILADNPQLTVRYLKGKDPQPVIVDSRLRCPLDARVLRHDPPVLIATSENADGDRATALASAGASFLRLPIDSEGLLDLERLLSLLGTMGIKTLMIEGGAQIITSILRNRLADQLVLTFAPIYIGGVTAVGPMQLDLPSLPRIRNVKCKMFGDDMVLRADLFWDNP
ncbi:MAG TPA: dihydrofolate reductase family protein [Syntrophales bacterium]|nr:dihydrofolate reductase family protein [Syntrophales bacterium]HOX94927.1 dihydrofolate reductase family protein [Syntrophales bacterium]HPI58331.1 dihydrofolate reductase family protein [Syntrophales bacterium]HPN26149.1 dihydrofolate reductase family protein [Syntrophales bacterium]HQM30526.1 dihydrofolate reductase family protein [Syntrophales bacterium]